MADLESKQWKRAQQTSLWKRTLGLDNEYVKPLRESFLDARENAAILLDKIRQDFPNLTVHNITHVDSLWSVADVIIGKNYPINPLEGYILGISFLIHDTAFSYDTIGGKEKLRDTLEWKDAFADGPGEKDEEEFKKECDFAAIRAIHAREAEELLSQLFTKDNGSTFYIIGNDSYRTHFGKIIGNIAASYHWNIDVVKLKLESQINPITAVPCEWKINTQKIACILRCADAGHIDNGRAPDCIYKSLIVNGVSLEHWKSQSRLGEVRPDIKDTSKLLITSTSSFKKEDFAAWNVAYEAIRVFDEELKKSNNLLKTIDKDLVFPRTGVMGANSKEELSEYIKTEGWQPCNIGVHASNINAMITILGGSIYGSNNLLLVAMRELIQNARDAIQARQKLEDLFYYGKITIRLVEEGDDRYIEVEDNGIGMSMDCIKHYLWDFGSCYWKSKLSTLENPGIKSKGFASIGKYGIGFFSVFMVAKSVEVLTKRYNKSHSDALKAEFIHGQPLCSAVNMSDGVSTIVRFSLKDDVKLSFKINPSGKKTLSLKQVLPILVAGLDVDVFFEGDGKFSHLIHQNIYSYHFNKKEWLMSLFIPCPTNIDEVASKMEVLIDANGKQRGMILPPEYLSSIEYSESNPCDFSPCIQTIGGLMSSLKLSDSDGQGFIGYLNGDPKSVSRDEIHLDEPLKKCLKAWTKEKYRKSYHNMLNDWLIADGFKGLINYCNLENAIINDNLRYLYDTRDSEDIQVGTMKGLMDIHRYLFVGIDSYAGEITLNIESSQPMDHLFTLFDSNVSNRKLNDELKNVVFPSEESRIQFKRLVGISNLPADSYEEIIRKYCEYISAQPFSDGSELALGVWVNLLLHNNIGKMIDWRQVDEDQLIDMMQNPNEVSEYFEPFLSLTYVPDRYEM